MALLVVIAVWDHYATVTVGTSEARVCVEAALSIVWCPFASRSLPDIRCHAWVNLDHDLWGILLAEHAIFAAALGPSKDIKKSFIVGGLLGNAQG